MSRIVRRGRFAPAPVPVDHGGDAPEGTSRRSFLRSSGGVAAVAAIPVAGILASSAEATTAKPAPGKVAPNPTSAQPAGPLMAYVHDAKAGTVVIMTGTTERTVKDRELVRRLTVVPKPKKKKRRARRPTRRPTDRKQG